MNYENENIQFKTNDYLHKNKYSILKLINL